MKQSLYLLMFMTGLMTLTSCGMYVGSPPKTDVHETTTTNTPPSEVHVYAP